jgi:hypothetical protein
MLRGGRDRAYRRQRREDQRDEVHGTLEAPYVREAGVERDNQKEREKNLHAGDDDAQLAGHLLEVAVKMLQLRLVAGFVIHALRVRHTDQR